MAKLRTHSSRSVRLTGEEFAALKEIAASSGQCMILDKHRDKLIAAGYIRELVGRSRGPGIVALTGVGLKRLERGK